MRRWWLVLGLGIATLAVAKEPKATSAPAATSAPTSTTAEAPKTEEKKPQAASQHLEVKWLRDSREYQLLTTEVYRLALASVQAQATKASGPWTVVLDVDETCLDNSTYQLERDAYGQTYDDDSFGQWTTRKAAPAIPGSVAFVDGVRAAGGHVAFVTNRLDAWKDDTLADLRAVGLFKDGDVLCTTPDPKQGDKSGRRASIQKGDAACGWAGQAMTVLAYMGDQMGDFPTEKEQAGQEAAFGVRYFLLPNPMYGGWMARTTRQP